MPAGQEIHTAKNGEISSSDDSTHLSETPMGVNPAEFKSQPIPVDSLGPTIINAEVVDTLFEADLDEEWVGHSLE
jgi:hypothetical protein